MWNHRENLISVIIPVYNVEKYIRRCLDSVLAQEGVRIEVILVDDGSTDSSGAICEEYAKKDGRVCVLHQKNGGQSSARNAGLAAAGGEYVGFVDSDDWISKDMYAYLLRLIQTFHADVSVCDYIRTGRPCRQDRKKESLTVRQGEELNRLFYRMDGGKSFFSVWNGLYKKGLLEGISFLEGEINEDIYFTYEVYKKAGRVVFSNLKKYFYFIRLGTVTNSRVSPKDCSQFRIWDRIVEREKGGGYYEAAVFNRKRAVFSMYIKAKLYGVSDDMPEGSIERWKKELKRDYRLLMRGKALDGKRKFALFCICRLGW